MKLWMFFVLSLLINFTEITFFPDVLANENTGMIQGKVSLSTPAPALPQIVVDKTIDFCGVTLIDPILMVQEGGVKGAVIWLEWQGEFHTMAEPVPPISLKSQNCLFSPRIQATRVGAYLHLNSGDEIAHNPHGWWNNTKTVFNITLLDPSLKFKRKLRWAGTYRVECDTHTWMKSYILVFNHPFFVVTDEKGKFTLNNVPVGTHTVRVWHEILGEQKRVVVVNSGKKTKQSFVFPLVDHRREILKPKTISPWPPNESR
ncbi:MAG: carboxypeptidase-like regulatory domain-containing protein [Gammaproteobacteria bacterium]|nr:carboxypeptidase-like regulatory domain-containing protein [Gammaproteobacteria bacterium]